MEQCRKLREALEVERSLRKKEVLVRRCAGRTERQQAKIQNQRELDHTDAPVGEDERAERLRIRATKKKETISPRWRNLPEVRR